jgi:hypothetical protein
LTPENHQRILALTGRLAAEIGHALDREPITVEEGVGFLHAHGNKTVSELLLAVVRKLAPDISREGTLTVDDIGKILPFFANRDAAEKLLLELPDPDAIQLETLEYELPSLLPRLRSVLQPFVKRLPPPEVGRPKKLKSPADRQRIRDEIGLLLAKGVGLKVAQTRIAQREDVSLSTIQRIWREVKSREVGAEPL